MKTIIKKKYFLLLAGFLLILAAIFYFSRWQAAHQTLEFKLLKKIYPDKQIMFQKDTQHYVIDGDDYDVKNLGDLNKDGLNDFVVIQIQTVGSKNFSFYSADASVSKIIPLIENVPDLIWSLEDEKIAKIDITLKDITGDDIPEIFVPLQENGKANRWYTILKFSGEKLIKMEQRRLSVEQTAVINFDDINREGEIVTITWHDLDSRGKEYYLVEGNILEFEKRVSIVADNAFNPEEYTYEERDKEGKLIYREIRSKWAEDVWNFQKKGQGYLDIQGILDGEFDIAVLYDEPLEKFSQGLLEKLPLEEDKQINFIINLYYELINHYGNTFEYEQMFELEQLVARSFAANIASDGIENAMLLKGYGFALAFTTWPKSDKYHNLVIDAFWQDNNFIFGGDESILRREKIDNKLVVFAKNDGFEHRGPVAEIDGWCKLNYTIIDQFTFARENENAFWKIEEVKEVDSWADLERDLSRPKGEVCYKIDQDRIKKYQ